VEVIANMSEISNKSYHDFIYSDEYIDVCSEMEIPLTLIIILIGIFLVVVGVATFTIVLTVRFKNRYYQLLDQKSEPKEMGQNSSN
jgi:hypothetical protein